MKRRNFTLIELLVAISLSLALISLLLGFYWQMAQADRRAEQAEWAAFQARYLENRLITTLARAHPPGKEKPFLTSQAPKSLLFTFDNGVTLDKSLSYLVIGRLYLSKTGALTLATWPLPKWWEAGERPTMQREVLMEGIQSLSFRFYTPPTSQTPGHWSEEWPASNRQLPALVELTLEPEKGENLTFLLHLPNTLHPITYPAS